jgi:hypothetical protein
MLDARCSILDARYSMLDAGCWMLDVTDSEKGKRGKGEKGTTPLPSAPFLLFSFSKEGGWKGGGCILSRWG